MLNAVRTIQAGIPQDCGPGLLPLGRQLNSNPRPSPANLTIVLRVERLERIVNFIYRSTNISGFGCKPIDFLTPFRQRAIRHNSLRRTDLSWQLRGFQKMDRFGPIPEIQGSDVIPIYFYLLPVTDD
jgi:hypothetical protein